MKRNSKNNRLQAMRISSLLLLLCFLVFWLFNEYEVQKERLFKDIDGIFYHVMRDMRFGDLETIAKKIDNKTLPLNLAGDTMINTGVDKAVLVTKSLVGTDSSHPNPRVNVGTIRDLKITVTGDDLDSNAVLQKGSAISFITTTDDSSNTSIKLDLTNKKASIEEVRALFIDTLYESMDDFFIQIEKIEDRDSVDFEKLESTKAYSGDFSGEGYFYAKVGAYRGYILRAMVPQILFSIFLFTMTTISFWLIYRSLKKQQQLTELKNDFIANITHELKTPITTVGVALEAISDFEVIKNPEKTKEYLQISRNELGRLSLLVDKVLQLSKLEKQSPRLKIESLSLDELIDQILQSMKLQFEKEKALIKFYKENGPVEIEGDRIHLMSVIYNLIDNALKYCQQAPKITIRLEDLGEGIKLVIQDNGIGIPPAYQQKIFDKFFRIPTGDQHNVKGHGLGLNYVSHIIKQHQGNIELESQVGEGSTFAVMLPKAQNVI